MNLTYINRQFKDKKMISNNVKNGKQNTPLKK